jgi:hypothetical protein
MTVPRGYMSKRLFTYEKRYYNHGRKQNKIIITATPLTMRTIAWLGNLVRVS